MEAKISDQNVVIQEENVVDNTEEANTEEEEELLVTDPDRDYELDLINPGKSNVSGRINTPSYQIEVIDVIRADLLEIELKDYDTVETVRVQWIDIPVEFKNEAKEYAEEFLFNDVELLEIYLGFDERDEDGNLLGHIITDPEYAMSIIEQGFAVPKYIGTKDPNNPNIEHSKLWHESSLNKARDANRGIWAE